MSTLPFGHVINDRYQLRSVIGSGATATVYRAWDPVADQVVAVKVLDQNAPTSAMLSEFSTAVGLRHPHVVRLLDVGQSDQHPWLALEWIDGKPFDEWGGGAKAPELVMTLAHQTLLAIDFLERRGIVHSDIKPSNLLVEDTNPPRVRLVDFGLANFVSEGLVGTPAYMAPELITGSRPSVQSDLYSLGVLILEALTGQNPYLGRNVSETLRRHRQLTSGELDLPDSVDPGTRAFLRRLLARSPGDRPRTAAAALEQLRPILAQSAEQAARRCFLTEPELQERHGDIQALIEAASPKPSDRVVVHSVTGPPGVGLRRLLDETIARYRVAGLEVRRSPSPGLPVPATREVWIPEREWDDATIQDWVQAIGSWGGRAPITLLVTTEDSRLLKAARTSGAIVGSQVLRRLTMDATRALCVSTLGADIDAQLARRLHELTRGIPGLVLELLRYLADERLLGWTQGAWSAPRGDALTAALLRPDSPLVTGYLREVGSLSDAEQDIVAMLAILGPVAPGELSRVRPELSEFRDTGSLARVIDFGRQSALRVPLTPLLLLPIYPMDQLRDVAREICDASVPLRPQGMATVRMLAGRAGAVADTLMAADHIRDTVGPTAELAFLRAQCDAALPTMDIAPLKERMVSGLLAVGRFNDVLSEIPEDGARTWTWRARAEALAHLGRTDEALQMLDERLEFSLTVAERAAVLRLRAETLRLTSDYDGARATLHDALEHEADLAPIDLALLYREFATIDWHQGHTAPAEQHAQTGLEHARHAESPLVIASLTSVLGTIYRKVERYADAIEAYREAASVFREVGQLAALGKATNNLGVCLYLAGRLDEASVAWEEALALAERTGDAEEGAVLANNLGYNYLECGLLDAAERVFRDGLRSAEESNATRLTMILQGNLGETLVRAERFGAAERALIRGRELAVALGAQSDLVECDRRRVELLLARQDIVDAESLLTATLLEAERLSLRTEHSRLRRLSARLALMRGRVSEAAEILAEDPPSGRSIDKAVWLMTAAEVDASRGRLVYAIDLAREAVEMLKGLRAAWHLERANLRLSEWEEVSGISVELLSDDTHTLTAHQTLAEFEEIDACLDFVAHEVRRRLGTARAIVLLLPNAFHPMRRRSDPPADSTAADDSLSRTAAQRVILTGAPLCLQDVDEDIDIAAAASVVGMALRSVVVVPINLAGSTIGLIYSDSTSHITLDLDAAVQEVLSLSLALSSRLATLYALKESSAYRRAMAMIAHELRSPLTVLMGFASLLEADVATQQPVAEQDVAELVELVNSQGQRLSLLIDDMRTLGLHVDMIRDNQVPMTPSDLLQRLAATAPLAKPGETKPRVVVESDVGLPRIPTDLDRLMRALETLLSHSLTRTTPSGEITLRAELAPPAMLLGEFDMVRFSIIDDAAPLSSDEVVLFTPLDVERQVRSTGKSLGIALARRVIGAHGGRLEPIPEWPTGRIDFLLPIGPSESSPLM